MRVLLFLLVSLVLAQGVAAQTPPAEQHYLERALQEVLDGRLESALGSINQELESFPNEARAYRARASLLFNYIKDPQTFSRALEDYDQAFKLAPEQDPSFYFQRARLLARMEQPARAVADLDSFIKLDPGYPFAYLLRARCHYSQAEFEAANADLDKTLQLAPYISEAYGLRGIIQLQSGRREQGVADLEKALELDPQSIYKADLEAARTSKVSSDGGAWASYVSPEGDFRLELPVPVRSSIQEDHLVIASILPGGHMYGVVRYDQDAESRLWKIDSAECRKAVFHFLQKRGGQIVQWNIEPFQGKRVLHTRMQSRGDDCETDTLVVLSKKYIYLVACVRTLKSPAFDPESQRRFRRSFRLLK